MTSNDDSNPWRVRFELTLHEHMQFLIRLVDESEDHELESELYHLYNTALSFTAFRTSTSTLSLSVHPQAMMRVPSIAIPEVDSSDRVLRSNSSTLDEQELSAVFNEMSLRTESSAVFSDSGDEPRSPDKEDRSRIPDFVSYVTTAHSGQHVLFLHEIKPYPSRYFKEGLSEGERYRIITQRFQAMLEQVIEQAQGAFHQYPADRELYAMAFVGLYFSVYKFLREKTPKFGENRKAPDGIPVAATTPHYLLNTDRSDYSTQFKTWWTRTKRAKGGARLM